MSCNLELLKAQDKQVITLLLNRYKNEKIIIDFGVEKGYEIEGLEAVEKEASWGFKYTYYKVLSKVVKIKGNVTKLEFGSLFVDNKKIVSEIKVNNGNYLKKVILKDGRLTKLELKNCSALTEVECPNNRLNKVLFEECPELKKVDFSDNHISGVLNFSELSEIESIDIENNKVEKLKLPEFCYELEHLNCSNNNLTELDLKNTPKLASLQCGVNKIRKIILGKCPKLHWVEIWGNQIRYDNMNLIIDALMDNSDYRYTVWGRRFEVVHSDFVNGVDNTFTPEQADKVRSKGWRALKRTGRPLFSISEYYGVEDKYVNESKIFAVKKLVEGEGEITFTPSKNLNEVFYGTEMFVHITPQSGYKLLSLTANGKDIMATKSFIVKETTEVKAIFVKVAAIDDIKDNIFRFYPNPVKDILFISGLESNEELKFYSMSGTLVLTVKLDNFASGSVNVNNLPNGLYIIKTNTQKLKFKVQH